MTDPMTVTATPLLRQRGFTLIELVAVIILLGILSAFIVPRFTGTGTFTEYTTRDQIIAALRYAQQRAMYDHSIGACHRFRLQADRYGPQRSTDGGVSFSYFGPSEWRMGIVPESAVAPVGDIYFDGLGNSVLSCVDQSVVGPLSISVTGSVNLSVCIETTGYAHAC